MSGARPSPAARVEQDQIRTGCHHCYRTPNLSNVGRSATDSPTAAASSRSRPLILLDPRVSRVKALALKFLAEHPAGELIGKKSG